MAQGNIFQVGEIVPVFELDGSRGEINRSAMNVLVHVLHFEKPRMRLPIRRHEAIAAKIVVARRAGRTVIAAVSPKILAGGRGFLARRNWMPQTLVHPIPDESALQVWLRVNLVPIRPKITGAVAHRVLVLAHDVRAGTSTGSAGILAGILRFGDVAGTDAGAPGAGAPGLLLHLRRVAVQFSRTRIHRANDVRVR